MVFVSSVGVTWVADAAAFASSIIFCLPTSDEAGKVWVSVGLLSAGKLLSFPINLFENYNFMTLFDKMC